MIPKEDMDGKTRLYPQALYKQQNDPPQGQDIVMRLNANNSTEKYWFKEDPEIYIERSEETKKILLLAVRIFSGPKLS
jgi:hypothetical protein